MENYNEYYLDPRQFVFLNSFQENWQIIRDEFTHFMNQASDEELKLTYQVMGPKSKTIKTKSKAKYTAFGILFQGLFIEEYIKLHVNYNPHMNRGYLGLIVPQGDVAMKICHDKYYWYEGQFMVLDHSYPHCPHNYTDYDRVVLVIDFFKPDKPREEVEQFEQNLVNERMKDNPYSLGVFGQSDRAQKEDFIKYGLAHQLEWDKTLIESERN